MRKALGAAALILALASTQPAPSAAEAAVLTAIRLAPGPQATELALSLDGHAPYTVSRKGAARLEVRLPGATAAKELTTKGLSDERVERVSCEAGPKGLTVVIKARISPIGYVQQLKGGRLSVRLFADAPGGLPKAPPRAATGAKAKKPEVKRAKKPAPKSKPGRADVPSTEPPKMSPARPEPPSRLLPGPMLARADTESATRQLAELPQSGPEIGGLLPGAQTRAEDKFAKGLLRSREAEGAYDEALLRLKAREWAGAWKGFEEVRSKFPRTLAAAKAAYRVADCLFCLVDGKEGREKALRAYLEAVSTSPLQDEAGRAYLQAGRLYQQGGYDYEALGYYGMTIKAGPDSPYALHAYMHRGDILARLGRYKEAEDEYRSVGKHFPNSALVREANFRLVRTLFAHRDFGGVERAYEEMRARWPETFASDPKLLRYIGETYYQQGDYYRCRQFLFYVLNIFPDMAVNHLVLCRIGDSFLAEGNRADSAKVYRIVLETFPGSEGAKLSRMRTAEESVAEGRTLVDGLGSGELKLGDLKLYEQIGAGKGEAAQIARVRVGLWHYWRREYMKAAEYLRDLLGREKDLPEEVAAEARYAVSEALYRQIRACFDQGRDAEVVQLYTDWQDWVGQDRAETYYYVAESCRKVHLARDAVRYFNRAKALPWRDDRRRENLYGLGMASLDAGDYGDAVKSLRELVEVYPDYPDRPEAIRALGRANYLAGKYQDAVLTLEESLKLTKEPPKRAEDFSRLGLALMGLSEYDRAAAAFQESLASCGLAGCRPDLQAEANLELGNSLYQLKRWDEAVQAYGRAAKLAPGGAVGQQALYKAGRCYLAMGQRKEAERTFGQGAAGGHDGVWQKASAQMLDGLQMGEEAP